jgi:hypothetical protein
MVGHFISGEALYEGGTGEGRWQVAGTARALLG